jgi:hypothetical protein
MPESSTRRVLITVRTYPVPARKNIEVSCTAGVTSDGNWIRLFPVPYRLLDYDKRFAKYQWIEVSVTKAAQDLRPESYKLNVDTIKICEQVDTSNGSWRERKKLLKPLVRQSMCQIRNERDTNNWPTLGLFRPAKIDRLIIEPDSAEWTPQQLANLDQTMLFQSSPSEKLEKIPHKFKYQFRCSDQSCRGHTMSCTDWEMAESYRRWRDQYDEEWEIALREKYEEELVKKRDLHFYVGTVHRHPTEWIIVGLFYPPRLAMVDLFDG